MHLHGQREVFPPGTVAEDSCWTFPGKFRIWMRVLYAALLPASCARARQSVGWAFTSRHCPGTAGCLPRQPPPGTHSSPAPGSCQAFPSQTGAVQNSECKKKTKKPQRQTLQNNLLQSGERSRRLAAGLAREVPGEERSFLG